MTEWQKTLAGAVAAAWQPPDRRKPSEWAETWVKFPASVRMPEYRQDTTPWTTEPLNCLQDPSVQFVTLMAGTQVGKSTIFEVGVPWILCNAPGNVMLTCQTEDDVALMAEARLWKVFDECKPVAAMLNKLHRFAKTKTRILFPHCFVELQGPGLSSLQSKSIRFAINDEAWMYEPGTLAQIIERTSAVWNRKIITLSQGGVAGDDLDNLWQQGTQEIYSYQCECGAVHPFSMQSIKWDETPDTRDEASGVWQWEAMRSTVRHCCMTCGKETPDTLENRRRMSRGGEYVVTNSNAPSRSRSFRVDATAVYWQSWADLAEQFLRARDALRRGDIQPLKLFTQKKEACPWKDMEIASVDFDSLRPGEYVKATYEKEKIEGEYCRAMAVDVQAGHYWSVARAMTKDGASKQIWEGKLLTWDDVRALQLRLSIPDNLVVVDAGNWRFAVCAICSQYNWTAMVGDQRDTYVHVRQNSRGQVVKTNRAYSPVQKFFITGQKLPQGIKNYARGYFWSNRVAKDMLGRLRAGEGVSWELPGDIGDEYKRHLFSEVKNPRSGRWEPRYKNADNHLWDCESMLVALMMILGVLGAAEPEEKDESQDNPG
jgi:hypothetical protein